MTAAIIIYILKFSLALTLLYTFYRMFLHRLTFYRWNRMFLAGGTLLSAVLPLINLQNESLPHPVLLNEIPSIEQYVPALLSYKQNFNTQNVVLILFISGCCFCALRLAIQYFSFITMKRNASLLHKYGNIRIFSSAAGGAFSFGNEIYIDTRPGNTAEEMTRILQHEIIHVKENHWIDLTIAEILCIVNWFNPVAWWMRNAIRQNLEYIADEQVIQKGYDPKAYQYLLLKVTGNNSLRIAAHFSMNNLKNRIKMINKLKSARVHLAKFVLLLPLVLLLLFAFRTVRYTNQHFLTADTIPSENEIITVTADTLIISDENGYSKSVIHTGGEEYIFIVNKKTKQKTVMSISEWNANKKENEKKYGSLPKPVVPPVPPVPTVPAVAPVPPVAPEVPESPEPVISPAPAASPAPEKAPVPSVPPKKKIKKI